MRRLARFAISVCGDDFVLHLQDAAGEKADFATSSDQLDAVIGALDEMLTENDNPFFSMQRNGAVLRPPGRVRPPTAWTHKSGYGPLSDSEATTNFGPGADFRVWVIICLPEGTDVSHLQA